MRVVFRVMSYANDQLHPYAYRSYRQFVFSLLTLLQVIKAYSPNLMVHPILPSTASVSDSTSNDPASLASPILEMLPRLHVLVIGPGLGRDPLMHATVARVIRAAREQELPIVLDADALAIVHTQPELVSGYDGAVLTPNVVEFGKLCDALKVKVDDNAPETARVEALAKTLKGVTVVQKGAKDYISNGETTLTVDLEGGKKRSGGQGDTLTGSIATFLGWRRAYLDRLWDVGKDPIGEHELVGLAAFGGSAITRVCVLSLFLLKGIEVTSDCHSLLSFPPRGEPRSSMVPKHHTNCLLGMFSSSLF